MQNNTIKGAMSKTTSCVINQVIYYFKLLHFSYKILNAPSKKITFLWSSCLLFPVLFYDWNTSINDSFRFFFGFFCRNNFLEGSFTFQWGVCFFRWGRASFLTGGGGVAHGGASILMGVGWGSGGGGRGLKKLKDGGGAHPHTHPPHHPPPSCPYSPPLLETLLCTTKPVNYYQSTHNDFILYQNCSV